MMLVFSQFFLGALLVLVCCLIHIIVLVFWTAGISRLNNSLKSVSDQFKLISLTCMTFVILLLSHSFQVWLWAGILILLGALPDMDKSIYFTLVTYTTVGYGDVVLGNKFHILGGMSAFAGTLNFGLSTAYLVALFQQTLGQHHSLLDRIAPWADNRRKS